jgi:hypothetical protein
MARKAGSQIADNETKASAIGIELERGSRLSEFVVRGTGADDSDRQVRIAAQRDRPANDARVATKSRFPQTFTY